MMDYLQILLLAIVQGLAEFLPISSSGHVMVLAHLCDLSGTPLPDKLAVNVILHFGTLLAVLVYYRGRIVAMIRHDWKTIGLLAVASLPAGFIGVGYKLWLEDWLTSQMGTNLLEHPLTAGLMFFATGAILVFVRREEGKASSRDMTILQALLIGFCQAAAILPGLSRSGVTIAAGLKCGLKREEAGTFSFLLAIPAIMGATLIEGKDFFRSPGFEESWGPMLIGLVAAFVTGLVALEWLVGWLKRGRLAWFAPWVFLMGFLVLIWQVSIFF